MSHYIFIATYSEELNLKLKELKVFDISLGQGEYSTTTVVIPVDEDFEPSFFNGYGKPSYKNKDNSSAVLELTSEEEFLETVKSQLLCI